MSLLGIDIGTTGAKAIVLEENGRIAGVVTEPYPTCTPRPLWSEQDPAEWWSATCVAVGKVLASSSVAPTEVSGVGVSGQMVGLVVLDRENVPLRPCIMWNDQRSAREAEDMTGKIGLASILKETSNPMFASFIAPKLEWVRRHEPDVFDRISRFMFPKDYIVYRLTGRIGTEVSDASGSCLLDVGKRSWSSAMVDAVGISADWLPECVESGDVVGKVSAQSAAATGLPAGTPVVAGAGDQPAQSLGCGVVEPGLCSVTVGTSGVVFAQTDRHVRHPDGTLHAFCHSLPRQWYVMGVMLSAGGSFEWLKGTLRAHKEVSFDELTELAEGAAPGSDGLIFLPYLSGERMPHNDPLARGGWIGLTRRHGLASMVRSVMEGITFGLYDLLSIIRRLGAPVDRIVASGGATESSLWLQMLADVLDAEIVTTTVTQGAAFGAAMLAGIGAGVFGSGRQAAEALIQVTGGCSPNREAQKEYQEAHAIYGDLYPRLRDSFRAMNDFSQRSAPEPSA